MPSGFHAVLWGAILLTAPAAMAAMPTELRPVLRREEPYSAADFRYLWMDIYRITFWADAVEGTLRPPYALSIRYHRDFSAEALVDRTCEEIKNQHSPAYGWCVDNRAALLRAMPGVKAGDRITALRMTPGITHFYKNGVLSAQFNHAAFTESFFAIWLGEKTTQPQLRDRLLGGLSEKSFQ